MKKLLTLSLVTLLVSACGVDLGDAPQGIDVRRSGCEEAIIEARESGDYEPYLKALSFEQEVENQVIVRLDITQSGTWYYGVIEDIDLEYQNYGNAKKIKCEKQTSDSLEFNCKIDDSETTWSPVHVLSKIVFKTQDKRRITFEAKPWGENCYYSDFNSVWNQGKKVPNLTAKLSETYSE